MIDNKQRSVSWQKVAEEFQSERDAAKRDVTRMQDERDVALSQLSTANAQNAALRAALREQCLITPASLVLENPDAPFVSTGCLLCNGRWEPDQPEQHAPRCLCEEPFDRSSAR